MNRISLKEVLKIMLTGKTFHIEYITYDKKRKTGGNIREYNEAQLLMPEKKASTRRTDSSSPKNTEIRKTKKPNHFEHATRNLKIFANGIPISGNKKCHIFLIRKFNRKKVYL